MLGYDKVYHMISVIQNIPDTDLWNEATDAKFNGKGKPYTREDFDQILGDCMVSFYFGLATARQTMRMLITLTGSDGFPVCGLWTRAHQSIPRSESGTVDT
jgi:glycogen synthase